MILGNLLLTSRLKNITIYSAAGLKYSIMLLKKGTLLQGGKYKIEKVLGQGGFGITYLATQINLNRKVAIKEFFMKDMCCREEDTNQVYYISSDSNFVDNFKNKFIKEAQTISSLNHRNIIRIHDTFEENGTAYYAMEYIDGCSISDILKQQGKLQEDVAIQYIKEVAEALNYIHSKHINHLDIKPSNIMVRQVDNSVVLIDFGVAKQYDLLTDEGTTSTPVGVSHGYSPLEQYSDGGVQNFSPQSDIYALGATLYTMVVGEKPPHAVSISQNGSPTIPNTISPNIRNAITAAMKLKRSERPQSVSSFVNILNGLDCNEETLVITKQKKSRRPIVLASTLLLLIAIIALSVFAWNQNKTSTRMNTNAVDTIKIDSLEKNEPKINDQVEVQTFSYKKQIGDNLVDYSIDYPTAGNPILRRNVIEWINESLGGQYTGNLKDAQSIVDFYGKEVELSNENYIEVKHHIKMKYQTEKYVTFEHSGYAMQEGAAHGFGGTICATFRKDDGRKFGWDMFSNYEGLQPSIKQGLKRYFEVSTDQELEEHLIFLPEGNTINSLPMPSSDPWLTPNGLTMSYGAYEIACYGDGEPTFTIPFNNIKNCLTATAKKLIPE